MAETRKAKVFMTGRSQAVRIPTEFRFNASEVYVRRDEHTGEVILSPASKTWEQIFAEIDRAGIPPEFMADRDDGTIDSRDED